MKRKLLTAVLLLMGLQALGFTEAIVSEEIELLVQFPFGLLFTLAVCAGLLRRSNLARHCAGWWLALYLIPSCFYSLVMVSALFKVEEIRFWMISEAVATSVLTALMVVVIWWLTSEEMKLYFRQSVEV